MTCPVEPSTDNPVAVLCEQDEYPSLLKPSLQVINSGRHLWALWKQLTTRDLLGWLMTCFFHGAFWKLYILIRLVTCLYLVPRIIGLICDCHTAGCCSISVWAHLVVKYQLLLQLDQSFGLRLKFSRPWSWRTVKHCTVKIGKGMFWISNIFLFQRWQFKLLCLWMHVSICPSYRLPRIHTSNFVFTNNNMRLDLVNVSGRSSRRPQGGWSDMDLGRWKCELSSWVSELCISEIYQIWNWKTFLTAGK